MEVFFFECLGKGRGFEVGRVVERRHKGKEAERQELEARRTQMVLPGRREEKKMFKVGCVVKWRQKGKEAERQELVGKTGRSLPRRRKGRKKHKEKSPCYRHCEEVRQSNLFATKNRSNSF